MRTSRLGPLFALVLLLAVIEAQAQQSPTTTPVTPTRDAPAVALLQSTIRAMGGGVPADSMGTGTVTETVGSESEDGTIEILTRGTDQSSETLSLPDLSQTTIYSSWMAGQTNGSATQQELTAQLAMTSQTVVYPLPFLISAVNNSDTSIQYVGQESLDGESTNHIRIWNTFASVTHMRALATFTARDVWLDSSTGLPAKISFTQQAAAGRAFKTLVELEFSNYQVTGGFSYPYTIKKLLNGTPWLAISIQKLSFNNGLESSRFQVNCGNFNL
jgi:hypothetical protein